MNRLLVLLFISLSAVSFAHAQPTEDDYYRCRDKMNEIAAQHVLKTVSNWHDHCQASGGIDSVIGDVVVLDSYVQCHFAGSRTLRVSAKIRIPWWSRMYECKVLSFEPLN